MPVSGQGQFQIKLDVIGDNLAELVRTQKGMADLRRETAEFQNMLKIGFGIDIVGRFNAGIAAIPGFFERAISRGVDFNATLEQAQLGIAAVLKQFDQTGRIKTFDDALKQSADAIEILKQKAKESPATFGQLVQTFQAIAGPALAANISIKDTTDLIVNMSQALAGLGINSSQILQETRALLTGNINADAAAAKILGITSADINKAKQEGQLYEFLSGKIAAFAEAGKRGANTLTTASSNLQDALDDLLATATKPIFDRLTKGVLDLNGVLARPEAVEALRALGIQIADLVGAGADLAIFAAKNADALILLAQAAAAVGLAFTAIKIKDLLAGIVNSAQSWVLSRLAVEAETVAVQKNTVALAANAAARGKGAVKDDVWSVGSGFASGALIALTAGAAIIKAIETSTLARLEAEQRISQVIADREKKRNDGIRALRTLEEAAKKRAELEQSVADIDKQITALQTVQRPMDPVAASSQYQVGTLKPSTVNLEANQKINELLVERKAIQRDIAVLDNPDRMGKIISGNQAQDANDALLAKQNKAYDLARARADDLAATVAKLRLQQELANATEQQQIEILNGQVTAINAARDAKIKEAQSFPAADKGKAVIEDATNDALQQTIPLLATIDELKKKITEESSKALEKAQQEAAAAKKQADALQASLAALNLAKIRNQADRISQDPFTTEAQKRVQLQPVLQKQNTELGSQIGGIQGTLQGGVSDLQERYAMESKLLDLQQQQLAVQNQLATSSFGGNFRADMIKWMDSFGSAADQAAGILTGTLGAGIDAVSQNLANAILQTESWSDAWKNIEVAIAQAFLTAVIKYAAARAAMYVISLVFGKAETAAGSKEAESAAAMWAPAATAASIASYGAAAAIGTAAFIAGLGIGTAAAAGFSAAGAFADGGAVVGPGGPRSDSIFARLSNGEHVITAAATSKYGHDVFDAFNDLSVGAAPLPVAGGVHAPAVPASALKGSPAARQPNITTIVIPDEREATRIARHSEARGDIVRIVREERATIFGN